MSKYICGFCINYDSYPCNCIIHPEYGELVEEDTCDDWEGEPELSDDELEAIRRTFVKKKGKV